MRSLDADLHVKTVRRLIRDGRLPAKRIGKVYRITRSALDEFAGTAAAPGPGRSRTRQVLVSSIVDVDAISPEDSQRMTMLIMQVDLAVASRTTRASTVSTTPSAAGCE